MRRTETPSPNHDARGDAAVDILLLHYTGMKSGAAALARLCDPAAKVSAHYVIDEDGTVHALVPEDRRAWHAGVSFWAGATDINARSIGIELVNPGHEYGYRAFPEAQVAALTTLCHGILMRHPIPSWRVLGHSDVAPVRKEDPGELFAWERLAASGIGLWPKPATPATVDMTEGLARYGYDPDAPPDKLIAAFQRHFRPACVNGMADDETRSMLAGLLACQAAAQGR